MRERLGALSRLLRANAALGALALALLGCAARPPAGDASASVAVEPVLFVGMVEVTGDPERGYGVLLSTATDEVLVADSALGRRLARYEGEVVAVRGRLFERAHGPATILVRAFRVLGTETRERAATAGGPRAAVPGG